jgi:hypothetical protein
MNILEFTCLRNGYTPAQLGLPNSVRDNARNQPLEGVHQKVQKRMYRAAFSGGLYNADRYRARKRDKAKGATA